MVGGRGWRYGDRERDREREGAQCRRVRTGSAVWLHCSISLPWPSQKQILHSLPPSLSHLTSLLCLPSSLLPFAPVVPLPPLFLPCPPFPPLPILSLNLSLLSPLLIPNTLLSSHQCNVLVCSAFPLYTAPKVTLARGRCVCSHVTTCWRAYAKTHVCMYHCMFAFRSPAMYLTLVCIYLHVDCCIKIPHVSHYLSLLPHTHT